MGKASRSEVSFTLPEVIIFQPVEIIIPYDEHFGKVIFSLSHPEKF